MSYTLNISFIFSESLENRFSLWCKNNTLLESHTLFRVIGNHEGDLTYCSQIDVESLLDIQKNISLLNQELQKALKKDFNEDIVFFISTLERL